MMTGLTDFSAPVPPDGYRWWYIDALSDDHRYGLAIIGFVGSVFSPYYFSARKSGPADPEHYCSLNIGLYGATGHKWCMTERSKRHLVRDATHFAIGPSSMAWRQDTLVIMIDEITVPFPSRVKGEIRLTPKIISTEEHFLDPLQKHVWRPVAPVCEIEVHLEEPRVSWRGHAYHDMNWGARPLEDDFSSWVWSRTALSDHAHIVYDRILRDGTPSSFAMTIGKDGRSERIDLPKPVELGTAFWRMRRPAHADHPVEKIMTLEDAPFYTRSLFYTEIEGQRVPVFHESLSLKRFTNPIIQKMLPFKMPRRR
jgi:carotenoid 1,2-hydratase